MQTSYTGPALTLSEIASMYNITVRTLNSWMKAISDEKRPNLKGRRILTPKEVDAIWQEWGIPDQKYLEVKKAV